MSIPKKTIISCPECGRQFETLIFDSLNTDYAADVPESIINAKRFLAECPYCKHVAHLEYDLLYNDLVHHAMIWVVHPDQCDYIKKIEEIRRGGHLYSGCKRIVSDMNKLREKVSCLEAVYDDRIVELCKLFVEAQATAEYSNFKLANSFYSFSAGKSVVFLYDIEGKELQCELTDDYYGKIRGAFMKGIAQENDSQLQIIDRKWAISVFDHMQ